MVKSKVSCPACRAIFHARAVAKRAAPTFAENLSKAAECLSRLNIGQADGALVAWATEEVVEGTILVVGLTFGHLPIVSNRP